jgi:hypothetical protein
MAKIRRLAPEQKERVERWVLRKAQSEHPNDRVTVQAYEFTDDEGCARCTAVITQHIMVNVDDIPTS